jgi:hypothetical protein
MVYLHSDMSELHVYILSQVYAIYVYHSSGALCGLAVSTVYREVHSNHRGFRVNKYWQHR